MKQLRGDWRGNERQVTEQLSHIGKKRKEEEKDRKTGAATAGVDDIKSRPGVYEWSRPFFRLSTIGPFVAIKHR
jgi:hypothetical protein